MIKFNWLVLRTGKHGAFLFLDILMIVLILLNLGLIIFDWHFGFEFFRDIIRSISPEFYEFYGKKVHPNFLLYDLFFVSIFIAELLLRWAIAIKRETYYRWWFYPFVHWYDVLGCIPLATFRWLRILRVVSMTVRLHKLGVIDLKSTYLFRLGRKYYKVVVEEISDRVVVNVLDGIQEEIKRGSPVTDQMVSEVIKPHQETLTKWLSHRIKKVTEHNYEKYRKDIKEYVAQVISESVKNNKEVKNLTIIPVVGNQISAALQESVSDITFNVVNGMVRDLASDRNNKVIEEVTDIIFEAILLQEEDQDLNTITKDIFIRALELVKEQVEIKQWKLEEEEERMLGLSGAGG